MKFARSQRTIRLWTDSAVHLVRIHCSISKDMSLPDDCHVLCTSENLCNTSCTHLAAFLKHQQRLTSKQIESVLEGIAGLYPFDTDQRERERSKLLSCKNLTVVVLNLSKYVFFLTAEVVANCHWRCGHAKVLELFLNGSLLDSRAIQLSIFNHT